MIESAYQKKLKNPIRLGLTLLKTMPAAFVAGLKVKEFTDEKAVVTIKYGWLTQNPFKSIYFACLSMAAEYSTAILIVNQTIRFKRPISTLVIKHQAIYTKKAVGTISFTCVDGLASLDKLNHAMKTGEAVIIETKSVGKDEKGDTIGEFIFVWSVKAKKI
jgi:hypothetical protein